MFKIETFEEYLNVLDILTDITNKKELPGATLVVKDYETGKEIKKWVSTNEPTFIELEPGIYTLTETIAPDGYILSSETITFTVKDDGTIDTVVMYNTPNAKEVIVEEESNDLINLDDLGLIISSNSIIVSLEEILNEAFDLAISFGLAYNNEVAESMDLIINGNYNNEVVFDAEISISESPLEQIITPSEYLDESDILTLLDFVVEAYELKDMREFELDLDLSIYTNGELYMDITGSLYLNIIDSREIDLRVKAYIDEYKNGSKTAWHQVDLNVISLTTLLTMDPSATDGMLYGYYGNNENDKNAVIKIMSNYGGITNLLQSVIKLLNIKLLL